MRLVAVVLSAVFCAIPAVADANSTQLTVGAHETFAFNSRTLATDANVVCDAYVNHKRLEQTLTDGELAMTVRGHGVSVTFIAKQKRAPIRVEVSNFRHRPVRVVIRIYTHPTRTGDLEHLTAEKFASQF